MVISAQVLSINVGGSSNNSNNSNNNKETKSGISDKNSSPGTAKITTGDEIENQEDQQKDQECSINPLVAKTSSAVWFKHQHYHQQLQQHPKWLLNCCTSNLTTAAQQLTVLIDSIGSCIPDPIATSATNIAIIPTAADSRNTTITTTTTVSTTAVPDNTTEQDMSRESRHVHVIGLPDSLSDERVSSFFSTFGRVQKVERLGATGFVVSFMDVRSAQKAHSMEPKFQGHQLRIAFHEQNKNGLVNPTASSNAAGLGSPQNTRNASSGSTTTDSHRRSSDLHSPNSSSSKQIQKERMPQHRLSSSRRQSRERERDRERGNSSRTDERSQRSRTSGNNDRRIGTSDSRTSRRSRHSPRASASSDSSRDSASPSGSSGHHHHASNIHTVQSTVIKLGASGSRRSDTNASNELSTLGANHDSLSSVFQGIQGIYVSNLPSSRTEGFLRDGLTNFFKKFGKVVHIMFETESGPNFVEQRRALVIFQRLIDVDKLKDVHHLFGLRLKIRFASHAAVTEAYSTYLATNGQECLSSQDSTAIPSSSAVDALASRASRTLYVGGLERRTTDDSLRSRFSCFGHILETEVKNWESPSPFAFIQFADIHSVVCAINAYAQSTHSSSGKSKLKMNWGRTIVSNKIWIGELPSSCSSDYLREKIRVSFTDTFNEVIYDPRHREALLLFSNNESAQRAFSMIKTKQVAFWNADEKKDVHVPVDYCSEKLHDYFVDRKFRGESGNTLVNGSGSSSYAGNSTSACSSGGAAIASTSGSSLLAPPPDPPNYLRDTSSRVECRRSGSSMVSRRRRSGEREGCRNSSRSLRYSSYNRSRRRREGARRNDVSLSSSSTSSTSSDSDLSSIIPDRKRTSAGHSKSNIQRLHRDKTPVYRSSSRQPNSPSSSKPDRNFEQSNSSIGVTVQTVTSRSSSRSSLSQLLPPPMPSAPILNPVVMTTLNEKKQQQEFHQPMEASTSERESVAVVRHIDFKHQQPSSSLSTDNELPHEANGKSTTEQRNKKAEQEQQTDTKRLESKRSDDSGFYNPVVQGNFTANEISAITSNRIEEIANTLVNVLQHHSKASTSTTASAPMAIMSGTHQSHTSTYSTQRSTDDASDSGRHHSSRLSASFGKRTKWPWGNDPIKNHCAIPLDGSANRGKDPRHRKYSPQTSISLPLPKFVHEHRSTSSSSRRNSIPDPFRSPPQQRQESRCSKNSFSAPSSTLAGCSLKCNAVEGSPPQKVARGRTHSSVSRSESSNSEAMLSPDPSNSTTQPSLVTSTIDIFGNTSPANNSSAYRERLDALGATFQNIEQKFQKTKQNTHLDYDRKGSSQRSYKFEEELERLKARTGSSSSTVTTSQSITTCSTTCSHPTSNTFTDSFTRARSNGSGTTMIFDSKDTESQKLIRTPLSVSIPMPSTSLLSTASSPYTTVFYTASSSLSNLPSPQFSSAQLRKPLLPPNITQSNNQTPTSVAVSRIAYPPDFSVPPPPLPQPPVPPTLSLTAYKSTIAGTSLISAPPPPPPLVCNNTSHLFDPTLSCSTTSLQPPVRNVGPQSGTTQSLSWRTSTKPSTPPPPTAYSIITSKQTSFSFASSTSKPSTSDSVPALEMDKIRSRNQGTDKVKEKDHVKMISKPHLPEKKVSKDSTNKQPSLSELFRQQAQDSSEVLKKQLKKVRKEKSDEALHHKPNNGNKKGAIEGVKEKHSKENEKKDQNVVEKEKKHTDEGSESQETKLKTATQKQLKEKKEKKEVKEKDKEHDESGELTLEKRKTQRSAEKNIKNKSMKDSVSVKQREKLKEKEQLQKDRAKKRQEEERRKQKEKEEQRKKKELTKKRRRKKESSSSSSEETSSSEVELHSFDRELKRLFMEEEASGSLGLSMYDRVKQRSSSKPDDAARKNRALELLQERTQSRRNNEQNRPKRVQLETSSSADEKDSLNDDGESDNSSALSVDASRARNKKKKTEPKGKSTKKEKSILQKKLLVGDETEFNDDDVDGDDNDNDDNNAIEKDSEKSESEEERSKRRCNRKAATSKSYKKQKKTSSLSLDDVFGTYSTDDESTKHSRGSIVPSLYKEKNEKEESGKKATTKIDESQKSKSEKEKTESTRRLSLKKERKKEKLDESENESVGEENKITPRKVESKQVFEKSIEKKVTGKKRCGKNHEVGEATTTTTEEVPEKKRQKTEKSLVEISMFREDDKKVVKGKTFTTFEQKKKTRKPGTNGQFEKKLAKKLKREQEERHEEQKREVDEAKQKDEKLQSENQRQKVDRAESRSSDGAGTSDVPSLSDQSSNAVVQSHASSSVKSVRKRYLRAENSEKVKRSRKEPKSPATDVSRMDSDSSENLKTDVTAVKQEPSQSLEKIDVNNMRDSASGRESKSSSPSDRTNTGLDLLQSVKMATIAIPLTAEIEHTEMDYVSEECSTNTALHTRSNEYCSPCNISRDELDQSKKYDSIVQKLETDGSSMAADSIIVSRHSPEDVHLNQNRPNQENHEVLCISDDEGSRGGIVDRNVIGRKNSVSSTNSSESGQTSLLSTSSANLETQLEDGPEDQQRQILGSEKIRISASTEILKSSGNCGTEQEFVEKTENEEKLSPNDMVVQLSNNSERIIFVPNSDAECSADPTVHGEDMSSNVLTKQQQLQNREGLGTGILDSVNDVESNGSFELIDEGRVGDVDSLPDQDIDNDIGGIRQQQSTYEVEHVRQEMMIETEEHADGSECIATVRMQDDVHDVQETEFAVQSIVLDDNRSQHSGEDGSGAMDYLGESAGETSSRRDSLTDTATMTNINFNANKEQSNSQVEADSGDNITSKSATDAEHKKMEPEDNDGNKGKMDVDDKRSDSHLDEVIDDVVAGGYMEVDAEQLMRINSKKAKEEAVLRAAAASTQGSITPKVMPSISFARDAETSQYDYQNAIQEPPNIQQQQYGSSGYHIQQSQHQQLQMPQQMPLQQGLLSQPPQQQQQQQQLQQNIVHGNSHMVLQQRSQQQPHMGQALIQQQQQSGRLTSYQQSQSQIMKVPETAYLQPQHLPPIEQRVQGTTAIPQQQQQQQLHSLQSKNVTSGSLPPYYSGRNAAGTASFASPQMSIQQQQQQHLLLQQQQTSDNMQNITNAMSVGAAVHTVSQLPDVRQQVVQAAPSQQQATQLVAQSHLQQQQSISYGSPMMTPTCSAAAVVAAQTVVAASRQLDLNKQMSLSTAPLQESISSNPYDLYTNLPKKPTAGAVQPQHQQQAQITQQQQQVKVSTELRQNCPNPSSLAAPLMGRSGGASSNVAAANLQTSRSNASVSTTHQSNRAMQHQQQQQQQLSPTAQQAVAFAIGIPGTTSPFTQMQQQYLQQMYRSTLFNTFQAAAATSAYSSGNVAAATGAYGSSGYSGASNNPAAAVAVAAAGVLPGTIRQDNQRQHQQQPHLADLQQQQQQQYLTSNLYQQSSPTTTLCSPQQANIAAHQLNSLYGAATGTFPISCESSLLSAQMTGQPGIYHVGVGQRQQDVKQPLKQKISQQQSQQQQVKTYAGLPAASVIARYPVMWQGIIALKTNETRVQMHKVGGNAEMCKRSLDQFTTTSNHMPLIRINQRMRMEAGQLESVQCKMMDEHSYIALICLSCGPSKEDIRNQSELLKERFVDYLESKQAAGICNVGNEQNPTPNTIVHIFPPCDFASAFLQKNSPDLLEIFRQQKASYLFVVITSAN